MNIKMRFKIIISIVFLALILLMPKVYADSLTPVPGKSFEVGYIGVKENEVFKSGINTVAIYKSHLNKYEYFLCSDPIEYMPESDSYKTTYKRKSNWMFGGREFPQDKLPKDFKDLSFKMWDGATQTHIIAYILSEPVQPTTFKKRPTQLAYWGTAVGTKLFSAFTDARNSYRDEKLYKIAEKYAAYRKAYEKPSMTTSTTIKFENEMLGDFTLNYSTAKQGNTSFGEILAARVYIDGKEYKEYKDLEGGGWYTDLGTLKNFYFVDTSGNAINGYPKPGQAFKIKLNMSIEDIETFNMEIDFNDIEALAYGVAYDGTKTVTGGTKCPSCGKRHYTVCGSSYCSNHHSCGMTSSASKGGGPCGSVSSATQPILVYGGIRYASILTVSLIPDAPVEDGFDLALRKYITDVNGAEPEKGTRVPSIDLYNLKEGLTTTAQYKHRKDAVKVKTGDKVTYNITIYNEGTLAGRALEVMDELPNGVKFISASSDNFTYQLSGNTLKFTRKSGNVNNLAAFNKDTGKMESETITVVCEVTETNEGITLTNVAWISDSIDENGNKEDRDSSGTNRPRVSDLPNYKSDIIGDSSNTYYPGEEDDDDFERLTLGDLKGLTIDGTVWEDASMGKSQSMDGYMDDKESRLEGINVYLYTSSGVLFKNDTAGSATINPTKTDKNGTYKFENLKKDTYTVVFEYDGLDYTTTKKEPADYGYISKAEKVSKAEELTADRKTLNDRFNLITKKLATGKDGKTLTLDYSETTENGLLVSRLNRKNADGTYKYGISVKTDLIDLTNGVPVREVNLGLVQRYQADFMVVHDLLKVQITGQEEQQLMEERDGSILKEMTNDDIAKLSNRTYELTIKEETKVTVKLTYQITVLNASELATGRLNEIVEYVPKEFKLLGAGYGTLNNQTPLSPSTESLNASINKIKIKDFASKDIDKNGVLKIFLVFEADVTAFMDVNNPKSIVSTAEISGYSFNNSKNDEKYTNGQVDKDSQPDNSSHAPSKVEDDTANAQALYIKLTKTAVINGDKIISGRFWDDKNVDGISTTSEPGIEGARVELWNSAGTVLYKETVTKSDGTYAFSGVPEGYYKVKFYYGDNEKTAVQNSSPSYTGNTYKSTPTWGEYYYMAPKSDPVEPKLDRSNATDDTTRRNAVDEYGREVGKDKAKILTSPFLGTYGTYKNQVTDNMSMYAWSYLVDTTTETPKPEYEKETGWVSGYTDSDGHYHSGYSYKTAADIAWNKAEKERVILFNEYKKQKWSNVNFGIVAKPTTEIKLKKEVEEIKLTSSDGTVIMHCRVNGESVEYLAGSTKNVSVLPDKYYITISDDNSESPKVEVKYKITVTNTGNAEVKIANVADFVGNTSDFDNTLNSGWTIIEGSQLTSKVENLGQENVIVENTSGANQVISNGSSVTYNITLSATMSGEDQEFNYDNTAEIVKYITNGAADKYVIPGNRNGEDFGKAKEVVITPPSGQARIYYILGFLVLAIITGGIIFIKKKAVK